MAEYRICISTVLQCMHLCIYIVYVQGVDQSIFGHRIELLTVLLYIVFNIHKTRFHILKKFEI